MTTDAQLICLMSHYLRALVGGDGPIHSSNEAKGQCPMCQVVRDE